MIKPFLFFLTLVNISFGCEFSYINNGEDLVYKCENTIQVVTIKNKRVWFNQSIASAKVQASYQEWIKQKNNQINEIKAQKDQFNCR
jgi:SH3-like domain-containing protein